jgi:hypothetical protein
MKQRFRGMGVATGELFATDSNQSMCGGQHHAYIGECLSLHTTYGNRLP